MTLRLFVSVDDKEVAAFTAHHVPRVGEEMWVKTIHGEYSLLVQAVQHQFDRSSAEHYSGHDVLLLCRKTKRD
jgi:hypothetical protein